MNRLVWLCSALMMCPSLLASELTSYSLQSDGSKLHFELIVNDVEATDNPSALRLYTKFSYPAVPDNQEEFRVQFRTMDGEILESPRVEPIGTPTADRWADGPAGDFSLTSLEGGGWRLHGSIAGGAEPFQPGDNLPTGYLSLPGTSYLLTNVPIGALPEPAMALTKKSSTGRVTTAGQMVHYDYEVFNTGTLVLHDVAVEDDNVDAPPECAFSGNDELAPEGEAGDSVKCTAQRTVTQQEIDLGGTLDNTATATSDETEPVQASLSLPFALFADGFESSPNLVTLADPLGGQSSIAIGADGNPVIAYHDIVGQALKVARCTSVLCTATSVTVVDDANDTGWYPSLAIGLDGLPVISYYDRTLGVLKVAKCNDGACRFGDEILAVVDDTADCGQFSALAIGDDGLPVISYHDATNQALRVAKCNDAACTGGDETITTINDEDPGGLHTAIAIGADGFPVISYQQSTGPGTTTVRVAKCNDPACAGADETISIIESTFIPMFESTAIVVSGDGLPRMAFYDSLEAAVKVARCNDAACSGGDESSQTVAIILQSSGQIGLALGADGFPVVSFAALRVARCNDADCAGGDETVTVVDSLAEGGNSAIAVGSDGLPVISYALDELRVTHCGAATCQ
jgi:hypothetical protein